MGLSERKVKQRIGSDPRNLAWAENAAKFGHTYLAKHGWVPGAGLGVTGDGRVSHIAVAQKLDQLGIGAGRPDGPDSIAWKQAKEFEGLLERLNAANGGTGGDVEVTEESTDDIAKNGADDDEKKRKEEKARRKEKRKEEKRRAKADATVEPSESALSASSTTTPESTPVVTPAPRRLAHRARFLAAKRLAGTSTTALSEILGVSSTPASTSDSTPIPSTPATPGLTEIPVLDDSNQITTSSQSVADYFKAKMRERVQAAGGGASISTAIVTFEEPDTDSVPRTGLGARRQGQEEEGSERPAGLGFATASAGLGFTGASMGIGFKRAASPPAAPTPESHTPTPTPTSDNAEPTKSDKERRKEKKRKRKEQETTSDVPAAENDAQEEERKAAKRARKEAKRAARQQQQEEGKTVLTDNTGDRSSKKKRKLKGDKEVD
ncbi:glycine rich nucleic binding domain, partial [Rhizoctonia solani]